MHHGPVRLLGRGLFLSQVRLSKKWPGGYGGESRDRRAMGAALHLVPVLEIPRPGEDIVKTRGRPSTHDRAGWDALIADARNAAGAPGVQSPVMKSSSSSVTAMAVAIGLACSLGVISAGVHVAGRAWAWLRDPLGWSQSRVFSGPVVLERIQSLQRLETCRYRGEVVVRGRTGGILPTWLTGDRLLFVGRGEVVAGLDLARLRPQDVR